MLSSKISACQGAFQIYLIIESNNNCILPVANNNKAQLSIQDHACGNRFIYVYSEAVMCTWRSSAHRLQLNCTLKVLCSAH